nr:MAG TPA_asm: hypothetical protein [Caudoviricetes sp.]
MWGRLFLQLNSSCGRQKAVITQGLTQNQSLFFLFPMPNRSLAPNA